MTKYCLVALNVVSFVLQHTGWLQYMAAHSDSNLHWSAPTASPAATNSNWLLCCSVIDCHYERQALFHFLKEQVTDWVGLNTEMGLESGEKREGEKNVPCQRAGNTKGLLNSQPFEQELFNLNAKMELGVGGSPKHFCMLFLIEWQEAWTDIILNIHF